MKSAHIESFFTESLPIQFKQGKTRTSKKFILGHFLPSPLMFSVATFFCFDYCSVGDHSIHWVVNPLSANITKWSNILKQFVVKLPTNCLSVFDHFVGLALKELKHRMFHLKGSSKNTSAVVQTWLLMVFFRFKSFISVIYDWNMKI